MGHLNGFIGVLAAEKAEVVPVDSVLPISKSSSESLSSSSFTGVNEGRSSGRPPNSTDASVEWFVLELFTV